MVTDVNGLRADWSEPACTRFGVGRAGELAEGVASLGIGNPLLVTDPGLAQSGMLRRLLLTAAGQGLTPVLFSTIKGNPTLDHARAVAAAIRAGGHDGVIAVGGGTAMEVAKVALLLDGEGPDADGFLVPTRPLPANPSAPPRRRLAPLVCLPTTAGSGAEARAYAVIADPESGRKLVLHHPGMQATLAILDPGLTVDLPPILTASTGMNALAHNLEAYCALPFDPACQGMAAEGVRLVRRWLPAACRAGSDLMARGSMMAAAYLGGMVFRRGLGGIQALADPIAALRDMHHGLAAAVLIPYVLVHNRPAVAERLERLAAYIGLENPGFESLLACLLTMREEVAIPHTLRGLGLDETMLPRLVGAAAADPFARDNPLPLDVDAVT
ncbi:MAG: hypothetical protein RLY86_4438, partial [Pseudomonadota bacterium]